MYKRQLHTVHGVIETPVFMNVGTAAAIKGAVATSDLQEIKTQVELSNTYHLHVRPGDEVVKKLGGLHKFMNWDKPIPVSYTHLDVYKRQGADMLITHHPMIFSPIKKIHNLDFVGGRILKQMCIRDSCLVGRRKAIRRYSHWKSW